MSRSVETSKPSPFRFQSSVRGRASVLGHLGPLTIALLVLVPGQCGAQSLRSQLVWQDSEATVRVSFVGVEPDDVKELPFTLLLYDVAPPNWVKGQVDHPPPWLNPLWTFAGKIVFEKDKPAVAEVKLQKLTGLDSPRRIEIYANAPALNLDYEEIIFFANPKQPVQSQSFRRLGRYPTERMLTSLVLNLPKDRAAGEVELSLTLRDADENVVFDKVDKFAVTEPLTYHEVDVTPSKDSVGPYSLEYKIENDLLGLYFNTTRQFGYANSLVPVSSIEVDDKTWFTSAASPYYATLAYYYSGHLMDKIQPNYPVLCYEDGEGAAHSGRRCLRIDYTQGRETHAFSLLTLPGLPLFARLWVKGNKTNDQLFVHWADRSDLTRQAWLRNANFMSAFVGDLDFDGWRCFRVPVLGKGIQVKSVAGSTVEVDAPINLLALTIKPGPPPPGQKPRGETRSVWIDDILSETQARQDELITMELRSDDPERRLTADTKVLVSIGNGAKSEILEGRLSLVAKDRSGNTVQTSSQVIRIPAAEFRVAEFSLAETFAKSPLGPIDVDVSFADAAAPGLRRSDRITFRNAKSSGLFWDFEKPTTYNGWDKGNEAVTEPGGASGSRMALHVKVDVETVDAKVWNAQPDNKCRVLLHPAMPGLVDRIEFWVRGGPKPVRLQPLFLDSGLTGVWIKDYNVFSPPPIEVNWQDWRKVEVLAPPPPPYYMQRNRYFLWKPYYPLNLVLAAKVEKEPSEFWVDNIRVYTHLLPEEELLSEIDFPDDLHIHRPGASLDLALTNFSAKEKKLSVHFVLESFQERITAEGKLAVVIPPGQKVVQKLIPSLQPGVYTLTVEGLEGKVIRECIEVLDPTPYFGPEPLKFLTQMTNIRKTLDMTTEKVYLDWDNSEAAPGFFHYNWFNEEVKKASADGAYQVTPVVGFSADWAGPHAQDSVEKGTYTRFMGNYLQVPVRLEDWSSFVRECLREYRGRFSHWIFWENPDLDGAPQGIPPAKYRPMLEIFKRWVSLYDPGAKVVAGGFNMDKALSYLESIENPASLEFDELAVQMPLGDLSPERGDIEGFLDELNDLLDIPRTRRKIQTTEMDWPIGKYVTPAQHAAYHARAMLILNSRGADPHRFSFVNAGQGFEGYGIFYRIWYGNSEYIQTLKPAYLPKPAYFALMHTRKFLADWRFERAELVPDMNLQANRAFLYRNAAGQLAVVLWRVTGPTRLYKLPPGWQGAKARDAFGFEVSLADGIRFTSLPTFIELPPSYSIEQLVYDLRMLEAADGKSPILLDLHVSEPDSCRRANYSSTGTSKTESHYGQIPGGRKLRDTFVSGLESEQFEFQLPKPGDVLLTQRWFFDGTGQKRTIRLNDGAEQTWDLTKGHGNQPGLRESTFVLRNATAGRNIVRIRYETPGNCAGYRLEPLSERAIDLTRWGILNAMQTKGELQRFVSATGTPLQIGKTQYETGLGSHAVGLIEYPLDSQFSDFEVTVGIDASTDGRGSIIAKIRIDGVERASSGLLNGFSKPVTLKVDKLESARRMLLIVEDAGDKNQDDLADWVEGKLYLKTQP